MPQAGKIMIIRHAEKPDDNNLGVTENGENAKHALTVRGWQRAGALISYFENPGQHSLIACPQFLYASAPRQSGFHMFGSGNQTGSNRSVETILPLSRKLALPIDTSFTKGKEREVADASRVCPGTVLIAWQHEAIIEIVKCIAGSHEVLPEGWPSSRFDLVYVLDLDQTTGAYRFSRVAQCLLDGDEATEEV